MTGMKYAKDVIMDLFKAKVTEEITVNNIDLLLQNFFNSVASSKKQEVFMLTQADLNSLNWMIFGICGMLIPIGRITQEDGMYIMNNWYKDLESYKDSEFKIN